MSATGTLSRANSACKRAKRPANVAAVWPGFGAIGVDVDIDRLLL
jgi:hypothetical protein